MGRNNKIADIKQCTHEKSKTRYVPPLPDNSKGGFYVKYDFNFKSKCVELYKNGQWHETPEGIGQKNSEKGLLYGQKLLIYTELTP